LMAGILGLGLSWAIFRSGRLHWRRFKLGKWRAADPRTAGIPACTNVHARGHPRRFLTVAARMEPILLAPVHAPMRSTSLTKSHK